MPWVMNFFVDRKLKLLEAETAKWLTKETLYDVQWLAADVFMWMNEIETILYEYRLKDTNELIHLPACPECDISMLILPHVLEGTPEDSDAVIPKKVRKTRQIAANQEELYQFLRILGCDMAS